MRQFFSFATPAAVANQFAADFHRWLDQQSSEQVTVCLSGGSTPTKIFELWASDYANLIDWSRIHFFWGDERCVPAESSDSNYGMAKRIWLDRVNIPVDHIHPMQGWLDPQMACELYEQEVLKWVRLDENNQPRFDLILLGMGTDGHIASIFPHQLDLIHSDRICEIAEHPETGQRRITLTGNVINLGRRIAFLITGKDKQPIFETFRQQRPGWDSLPISFISGEQVAFYLESSVDPANVSMEKA